MMASKASWRTAALAELAARDDMLDAERAHQVLNRTPLHIQFSANMTPEEQSAKEDINWLRTQAKRGRVILTDEWVAAIKHYDESAETFVNSVGAGVTSGTRSLEAVA